MRKFYIENEYGQRLDLTGDIFLNSPKGLGFENSIKYAETDGFFVATSRQQKQVEKKGSLVFLPPAPYERYRAFVDFVTAAKSLKFAYNPDGTWYFVDVDIRAIEKTEKTKYGTLECPFVFSPTSPLYTYSDIIYTISGDTPSGLKLYPYSYPHKYATTLAAGEVEIAPISAQLPSDFQVTIPGPISAPKITATVDGEIIGEADLSELEVASGETLVFTTVPTRAGVFVDGADASQWLELQSGVPSFFHLPTGKTINLALSADSLSGITANIRIYKYYRSI